MESWQMETARLLLKISIVILVISGLIDLLLWVTVGFKVPSFAISALSISTSLLNYTVLRLLEVNRSYVRKPQTGDVNP